MLKLHEKRHLTVKGRTFEDVKQTGCQSLNVNSLQQWSPVYLIERSFYMQKSVENRNHFRSLQCFWDVARKSSLEAFSTKCFLSLDCLQRQHEGNRLRAVKLFKNNEVKLDWSCRAYQCCPALGRPCAAWATPTRPWGRPTPAWHLPRDKFIQLTGCKKYKLRPWNTWFAERRNVLQIARRQWNRLRLRKHLLRLSLFAKQTANIQ